VLVLMAFVVLDSVVTVHYFTVWSALSDRLCCLHLAVCCAPSLLAGGG
jgi:hypothetical protein